MSSNRDNTTGERDARIRQIVQNALSSKSFSESQLIESHPDLMPELGEQLKVCRMLQDAKQDADETAPTMEVTTDFGTDETTSDQVLVANQQFGGYRLIERLGKGGFGEVWKVERTDDGRILALKVLNHGASASEEAVQRFEQEGRLAARMNHPRTVFVVAADVIEGRPTIAMEYVSGGTLQDVIDQHGPMDSVDAVEAILDVIGGLEAAQRLGIIHRDIKPSNCFIDENGRAKIGDFGISKSLEMDSTLTQTGAMIGTPAFASPEQLRGQPTDMRTDIYGLGATLYALLTGEPPFKASNVGDLLARVASEKPTGFKNGSPKISVGLQKAVRRMMGKQAKDRFDDYLSLRRALLPHSRRGWVPRREYRFRSFLLDHAFFFPMLTMVVGFLMYLAAVGWPFMPTSVLAEVVAFALMEEGETTVKKSLINYISILFLFGLCEWCWGATPARWFVGLSIRDLHGNRASFRNVIIRNMIFWMPVLASLFTPVLGLSQLVASTLSSFGMLVMCSTGRASNGYAGLHELLSGTRTFKLALSGATVHDRLEVSPVNIESPVGRRGPFTLLRVLSEHAGMRNYLAFDEKLGRQIWLEEGIGVGPREPQRDSRLKWLISGSESDLNWNAYDFPPGELLESKAQVCSADWAFARSWLRELLSELAIALEDGSMPSVLSTSQLWVTTEGTLKLLPSPFQSPPGAKSLGAEEWPKLIRWTVGMLFGTDDSENPPGFPMPEYARRFLLDLYLVADQEQLLDSISSLERIAERKTDPTSAVRRTFAYFYLLPGTVGFLIGVAMIPARPEIIRVLSSLVVGVGLAMSVVGWLILISSVFVRGGVVMRLCGLTLQDSRGQPASASRSQIRTLLSWLLALPLVFWGIWVVQPDTSVKDISMMLPTGLSTLFLIGALVALFRPTRSLQDRLAGTHIVRN